MARSISDTIPSSTRTRYYTPPAGMRRAVTRRHLQTQLEELDMQIETLLRLRMHESWRTLERAALTQPAAAEIVWTGRLELLYLNAVREALLETLTYL